MSILSRRRRSIVSASAVVITSEWEAFFILAMFDPAIPPFVVPAVSRHIPSASLSSYAPFSTIMLFFFFALWLVLSAA